MKIKEWIKVLKEQDQEAQLILFDWIDDTSMFSPLAQAVTQDIKSAFIVTNSEYCIKQDIKELLGMLK